MVREGRLRRDRPARRDHRRPRRQGAERDRPPLRAALLKGEAGFEPVAIGFIDFARLPKLSPAVGATGPRRREAARVRAGLRGRGDADRAPRGRPGAAARGAGAARPAHLRRRLPAADTRRRARLRRAVGRLAEDLRSDRRAAVKASPPRRRRAGYRRDGRGSGPPAVRVRPPQGPDRRAGPEADLLACRTPPGGPRAAARPR